MEGRPHAERELALRAQRGDAHAYEDLIRPHQEIAFRVAYGITRNAADAEDATQDALVKAWRALGGFRVDEPLRPWLLRIVANEARNRRRSVGRHERLTHRAAQDSGEAAPSPEEVVLAESRRAELLRALDELPADARDVLAYRYLLDLSEEETAAALGVAVGTVKSRTSRALDRLKLAVAIAIAALGVAFAVPQSRGAILRFFDIGSVRVRVVDTLPRAAQQPLNAGLGPTISRAAARATFPGLLLPPVAAKLHLAPGRVLSAVFETDGGPVLLSEYQGGYYVKKLLGGSTGIEQVEVRGADVAVWLSGAPHVFVSPAHSPRLAGSVLLWATADTTYRLEGPKLRKENAISIAQSLRRG